MPDIVFVVVKRVKKVRSLTVRICALRQRARGRDVSRKQADYDKCESVKRETKNSILDVFTRFRSGY